MATLTYLSCLRNKRQTRIPGGQLGRLAGRFGRPPLGRPLDEGVAVLADVESDVLICQSPDLLIFQPPRAEQVPRLIGKKSRALYLGGLRLWPAWLRRGVQLLIREGTRLLIHTRTSAAAPAGDHQGDCPAISKDDDPGGAGIKVAVRGVT
jgi:hypothetical protein